MKIKNNIFSLFGLIGQLVSLVIGFFPVVFKMVVYECNPYIDCTSYEDSFTKSGETFAYNLFFDPSKFFSYKNMSISVDAFTKAFAILFIVFSVLTLALGILSFLKKKVSYFASLSAFAAFILFFVQAFNVCFFSVMHLTWKYVGDFGFGCRVIFFAELISAILFILNGKIKFKQKTEKSDNNLPET